MQRQPLADAREVDVAPSQVLLDHHVAVGMEGREHDLLAGLEEQLLEERYDQGPLLIRTGREHPELPHPKTDHVAVSLVAFERSPSGQMRDDAVHGRQGQLRDARSSESVMLGARC